MDERLFAERVAGWPVGLLRIATGVLWLVGVIRILAHPGGWPDRVQAFLQDASHTSFGFYQGFVGLATDHYQICAWLVLVIALCTGIALTLGVLSRLAAALGLLLLLNVWCMQGAAFWEPLNPATLFILMLVVLTFTRCGRLMGLDFFLSRRRPEWFFW